MGKFNFGEAAKHQQRRRAATFNNAAKRKATQLSGEDIPRIAELFFLREADIEDIISDLASRGKDDVASVEIVKIINGYNFNREWSLAVTNLLAKGHDVTRRARAFMPSGTRRIISPRQSVESVLNVRQLHLNGGTLAWIVGETGINEPTVRAIIRNETYKEPKYRPEGWDDAEAGS